MQCWKVAPAFLRPNIMVMDTLVELEEEEVRESLQQVPPEHDTTP